MEVITHTKRNLFIDYLKALAIILVVIGHVMQFTSSGGYLQNPVFILIYSFHMPLFMSISGYLFYSSVHKKSFKNIVEIKFKQLLIPLSIWTIIMLPQVHNMNLKQSVLSLIILYLHQLPQIFWFLWFLFVISVISAGVVKLFKDAIWVHFVVMLLMLFIPDYFAFFYVKYMYPFFIAGYAFNKVNLSARALAIVSISSIIAYCILLPYWHKSVYIYVSEMTLQLYNLKHDLLVIGYRYIIGFLGIIGFIFFAKQIFSFLHPPIMQKIGQQTLGIYVIGLFFTSLLQFISIPYMPVAAYIFLILFLSVLIITLCLLIIVLIEKSKLLNRFLLGAK